MDFNQNGSRQDDPNSLSSIKFAENKSQQNTINLSMTNTNDMFVHKMDNVNHHHNNQNSNNNTNNRNSIRVHSKSDIHCYSTSSTSCRIALMNVQNSKWIRILTVLAYIIAVSMAAIILTIYYTFLWDPYQIHRSSGNENLIDRYSLNGTDRFSIETETQP